MNKRQRIVFGLIFLVSVLAMSSVVFKRFTSESAYKQYAFIMDYASIEDLAKHSEEDLSWWFQELRDMGADYLSVSEETLDTLNKAGKIAVLPMEDLVEDIDWVIHYPSTLVDAYRDDAIGKKDIIVATREEEVYNNMLEGLTDRYGKEFFTTHEEDGKYVFHLKTAENALKTDDIIRGLGIYYDSNKIAMAKNTGLKVVLRPFNFNVNTENLVRVYKDSYDNYNITPEVYMVAGKEVIGFGNNEALNELAQYIDEHDMTITMIEKSDQREHLIQKGMESLLELVGYEKATRTFATWDYIQKRYAYLNYKGPEEITNTYYRAITERNIRYIYFKPFLNDSTELPITELESYKEMFSSLEKRLEPHGITPDQVSGMPELQVSFPVMVLVTMGLAVLAIWILNGLVPLHEIINYILLGLGVVGIVGINFVAPNMSRILLAFCSSVGFPAAAIVYFVRQLKDFDSKGNYSIKVFGKSILLLLVTIAICVLGGLYIAAILGDSRFLLELDIFRGVKLSLVGPIGLMAVFYFIYHGYGTTQTKQLSGVIYKTRRFLDESIKVKYVILLGIAGALGFYLLARSGHETNVQPMNLELMMRNFLELNTLARPRNKEFLIAYPALILLIYTCVKGYKPLTFVLAMAFSIGLADVVNTFCHIRSPLYLSLARVGYGLVFGILLGVIYLIGFMILEWLWNHIKGYVLQN